MDRVQCSFTCNVDSIIEIMLTFFFLQSLYVFELFAFPIFKRDKFLAKLLLQIYNIISNFLLSLSRYGQSDSAGSGVDWL